MLPPRPTSRIGLRCKDFESTSSNGGVREMSTEEHSLKNWFFPGFLAMFRMVVDGQGARDKIALTVRAIIKMYPSSG